MEDECIDPMSHRSRVGAVCGVPGHQGCRNPNRMHYGHPVTREIPIMAVKKLPQEVGLL